MARFGEMAIYLAGWQMEGYFFWNNLVQRYSWCSYSFFWMLSGCCCCCFISSISTNYNYLISLDSQTNFLWIYYLNITKMLLKNYMQKYIYIIYYIYIIKKYLTKKRDYDKGGHVTKPFERAMRFRSVYLIIPSREPTKTLRQRHHLVSAARK
ncbi:uncharacterized protein YALI1_F06489g [Yarrowia lipolytica]|uniref:Uncharacterized protein n=1 Tax=Yarrowia lipolytica TaxID=4952 RepID=A0A1D8NLZ0_YARLL|nr:hypothetical protein YALI1_F06489g [Yarrowia lipolytica]